jgi:hypothetical protein
MKRLMQSGFMIREVNALLINANILSPFAVDMNERSIRASKFLNTGMKYPNTERMENNTLIIPLSVNFPSVDALVRVDNIVIAFQVHTSSRHRNVSVALQTNARIAKWLESGIKTIILLYLSPSSDCATRIQNKFNVASLDVMMNRPHETRSNIDILRAEFITLFCSRTDFTSLEDMQWTRDD